MPTVATAHIDSFARDHLPPREQWPEFRFELPELAYPERLNCARVLLDEAVDEGHGERSALHAASGTWSYNQVLETSCRIAHVLVEDLGLVPGNRVLLRGANTPWLVACWFAVIRAGGIAVTTMPMLRAGELAVIAEKAQISHALCDARLAEELEQAAGDTPWLQRRLLFGDSAFEKRLDSKPTQFPCIDTHQEDVALLAFTSGTTGVPKATMHFHRDVLAMSDTFARYILRTSPDDIYLGSPPLGFTFGLGALLVFPFRFRAASVLVEAPSPDKLLAAIEQFGVTALFTAPTAYRSLLGEIDERHLRTLKTCVSAGEPLPRATSDAWHDRTGIRIIDGIGTTEMIHIFLSCAGEEIRPGSTGKPVPGYEVCVLDERNRPLPPGNSGRLAVKGPTGCRYLGDKRQRDYVIDGWNVTGDRYRVDEDGYFWFIARADDMIISSGYNIAAPEVEAALLGHDAVRECAVVGQPDEQRGAIVKAYVVLANGQPAREDMVKELQDFVKRSIAPYKYPRAIEFVGELPKTQTGKLQRFRLRERQGETQGRAPVSGSREAGGVKR